MNPQETKQFVARDEGWVPAAEMVKISPTNVRLETIVKQKEETFQVVIDVIKNSTYFKAFTISADVPKILMQQFWHTITKVKGSNSYEFLLSNKECVVNAEVFRKILDICPRKKGEDFTKVPNDDDTLTFLVGLGYSSLLYKYTNMFVDHMHQPWRTLAACINKCLCGKTASNEKLRKSRIDILWGMFYRENKSRGKGSQGKKTGDTTKETIEVTEESDPEPLIKKKTSRRRVTKKEATISAADNIIPDPDLALKLGKSISLTEAEEEAVAREVHATHEKIVSEAVLETTRRRQTWVTIRDTSSISKKKTPDPSKKIKGVLTLTPIEQEAVDIMKVLKESRKIGKRQSGTGGSDEGAEIIHKEGADEIREHSDRNADAQDDDEETESDFEDIYKYKIKVCKDDDLEMKDAKTVKEKEELTDAEKTAELTKEITEQPLTSSSLSVSSDYGTQFLNLSQDEETFEKPPVTSTTSELQQTTPIPTTIPTPPINTEPPSTLKSLRSSPIKWEQDEKKQMATYTIKSIDKAALKEFDLKGALFKAMHENKSANRNPANYRLYHAQMKALIEDENAMDKDVADTVKDHKRKHDSDDDEDDDDDDDDEGPSAGPNQGKTSKKRRTRESEFAKKPSTTKETSKGKALKNDSKIGKSAPVEEPVEEPTKEVSMDEQPTEDIPSPDDMHVLDPEDTDNAHIPKVPTTTTWFRPLPEEERPASPKPKWVIPLSDLPEADNNWADALARTYQDPDENKLHNKTGDIGSFIKWYCRRIGKDKLSKADFKGPAFMMVKDQVDLVNLEGHWIVPDICKPLPLGGPSGQLGIESYQTKLNLEQPNRDASDFLFKEHYTIVYKPRAVIYSDRNEQKKMMRINEVHKFSDGMLTRIRDKMDFMVKDFKLFEYNKGMESRIWSEDDKQRIEEFIEVIGKRLKIRRIFRSLNASSLDD
uniref:Uncharacterized protein n=1 Tax=Tanacetum cinerariifolium TaxID=118510 RepID=A0A6L2K3E4_TANCI|nr:hypothetical protein [Tanacetum cinerariifolium]